MEGMNEEKYVFISQPMSGVDESVVLDVRNKTQKRVLELLSNKNYKVEFISTYERPHPYNASRFWYLGEAIKDLDGVNLIVFCKGYENAKGCLVEKLVAELYDIPYIVTTITEDGRVLNTELPEI